MSEDIVTRLHEDCACSSTEEFGYNCTNCDAADEIERLRKELGIYQDLYATEIVKRVAGE